MKRLLLCSVLLAAAGWIAVCGINIRTAVSAPGGVRMIPKQSVEPPLSAALAAASPSQDELKPSLDAKVKEWIKELSQRREYASWKDAEWESIPLGPGTHAWAVLLRSRGREIGYLIVNAGPDGQFRLGSYGKEAPALFSMAGIPDQTAS